MYVYERDWKEQMKSESRSVSRKSVSQSSQGQSRTSQKRTELEVIGERRPQRRQEDSKRSVQRNTELRQIDFGDSKQVRVSQARVNQNSAGRKRVEQRKIQRGETERESRERQLRQRKLREKQRREKEIRRKRRTRRRIMLIEICLVATVVVLFVGRDIWMRKLRYWVNSNRAGTTQEASRVPASSLDSEIYPESLRELLEKNPEAEEFVMNYPKNKDKHPDIDLSGEVIQGTIPLFIQWDERWGYENYGGDFLAVTGCGPTCLSMVYCGLRGDTTQNPLQVAQWAEREGYYVDGAGSSWDLMSYGAQKLGLTQVNVVFDAEHILSSLRNGSPIICAMRPGDFTTAGHFIVLAGVDEDGKIIVRDPNSRINSEKSWAVEDLMPQIKNLWGYQ